MGWAEKKANLQGTAVRSFPEAVLYTPEGLAAVALTGVFREAFVGLDLGAQVEISSTKPTFDLRRADLPADPSSRPGGLGDRLVLVRTGTRYRVAESTKDGEGMLKLFLQEQVAG